MKRSLNDKLFKVTGCVAYLLSMVLVGTIPLYDCTSGVFWWRTAITVLVLLSNACLFWLIVCDEED